MRRGAANKSLSDRFEAIDRLVIEKHDEVLTVLEVLQRDDDIAIKQQSLARIDRVIEYDIVGQSIEVNFLRRPDTKDLERDSAHLIYRIEYEPLFTLTQSCLRINDEAQQQIACNALRRSATLQTVRGTSQAAMRRQIIVVSLLALAAPTPKVTISLARKALQEGVAFQAIVGTLYAAGGTVQSLHHKAGSAARAL